MPRRSSYPAEVRAGVIAALSSGAGVRETARNYDVPVGTVGRWKDELEQHLSRGADAAPVAERSGTPDWYPQRAGTIDAEVRELAAEMVHGARILMAHLVHPANLVQAEYGDVVGALNTVADRVARVAEAASLVHQQPEALPPGG